MNLLSLIPNTILRLTKLSCFIYEKSPLLIDSSLNLLETARITEEADMCLFFSIQ